MPEITAVDALWGRARPNPAQAVAFLRAWHGDGPAGGLVSVVPLDSRTGWAGRSAFGRLDEMCETLESCGLDDMIWQRDELGERRARTRGVSAVVGPYNLYTNVGELGGAPDRSKNPFARGCKKDMAWVPGAWIDLDVGDGRFENERDCIRALSGVGVEPSILVQSGSGGVHAYWRVAGGCSPDLGELLSARVIEQVRATSGVKIDSVFNSDRIMRLPGGIRWPKPGECGSGGAGVGSSECRIILDSGPVCEAEALLSATESVWQEIQQRRKLARESAREEMHEAVGRMRFRGRLSGGRVAASAARAGVDVGRRWARMRDVACAEMDFALEKSWENILGPFGWRLMDGDGRPDAHGRRTWTRPGAGGIGTNPRSLITDWDQSPDVASLLSEAPETGLWRLKEAGVPLTKMRVWVELAWHGDMAGFLESWLGGGGGGD